MATRLIILALHLSIFFALSFGFEHYIVPLYGYEGYEFYPNAENWYMALVAVTALSLVTPISHLKPSTLFQQLTLTVSIIPMLVLFYAEDKSLMYPSQVVAAYLLTILLPRLIPIKPIRFPSISEAVLQRRFLLVAFGYIGVVFMLGGGAYLNFDFSKVYDFRSEAANNLPQMFGYVTPVIGKVIIPFGFVLSLVNRKYVDAALYAGCAFLMFGLTAHKGTVFDPLLVLFIYLVALRKNLSLGFNAGILLVILVSNADFALAMTHGDEVYGWIGTLMLARMFFLSNQINYMYYDFFTTNEWVYFADSKITMGLISFDYPLDIPHLIGLYYFNSELTNANTGWFGSGYAQAGFAGLVFYAVIISLIYKYVDVCARLSGKPALVAASIVVPISNFITSSDIPTTLLTHGLLANLILITCLINCRRERPESAGSSSSHGLGEGRRARPAELSA